MQAADVNAKHRIDSEGDSMSKTRSLIAAAFLWTGSLAMLLPLGYMIFDKASHQVAYGTTMVGGVTLMAVGQYRSDRRQG